MPDPFSPIGNLKGGELPHCSRMFQGFLGGSGVNQIKRGEMIDESTVIDRLGLIDRLSYFSKNRIPYISWLKVCLCL